MEMPSSDYDALMAMVESEMSVAPLNELVYNPLIESLLLYHPQREALQLEYAAGLVVHELRNERRLYVVRVHDVPVGAALCVARTDYVSMARCARACARKQDEARQALRIVHEAFYNALRPSHPGFGRVHRDYCDVCGEERPLLLEQDGVGDFEALVQKFMQLYGLKPETLWLRREPLFLQLDKKERALWVQFYGRAHFVCLACRPHCAPPPLSPGRVRHLEQKGDCV